MSKETIKSLIDLIPEQDIETIYKVIIKFIPEEEPEKDEIKAILEAQSDRSPTVPHEAINWE
ncbi:MAG: hypothetical protein ACI4EN_08605 [Butyrivibrio sp.]